MFLLCHCVFRSTAATGLWWHRFVFVVAFYPGHAPRQRAFVAALWRHIEEIIRAYKDVEPAGVGRISVQYLTVLVLDEGAQARGLFAGKFRHLVVVLHLAARLFFRRERDVEIAIEVVAERRHPFELPSHPFLVGLYFGERRARYDDERHVPLGKMNHGPVEMIGEK